MSYRTPGAGFWWIVLLILIALNVSGFVRGPYNSQRAGRIAKVAQLPQSFLLSVSAAIVWLNTANDPLFAALALLVFAGIIIGFAGDLFMANVFSQTEHVLFGMAAFGIGHMLYLLAFREIAVRLGLYDASHFVLPEIVMCIAGISLWAGLGRVCKREK